MTAESTIPARLERWRSLPVAKRGGLRAVPIPIKQANVLVQRWHRHHRPVHGALFAIGCALDDNLVGAAIVGRPVARKLNDGATAEVVRLVTDGTPNACSVLYAAAARAWRAMGGHAIVTYILPSETGVSLRAAGWRRSHATSDVRGWSRPSRERDNTKHLGPKVCWIKTLQRHKADPAAGEENV